MASVRQWVAWGPSWAANSLSKKPDSKRQIHAFSRMQVYIEMCMDMHIRDTEIEGGMSGEGEVWRGRRE